MDNYAQIYMALPSGKAHDDMKFRVAARKNTKSKSKQCLEGEVKNDTKGTVHE